MPSIHIGPNSYLKNKLWKQYQANKFHPDVVLVCDDGTTMANRLFLAAQSKVHFFAFLLLIRFCKESIKYVCLFHLFIYLVTKSLQRKFLLRTHMQIFNINIVMP